MVTVPLLVVIMALPVIETVFPPGLLIIGLSPMLIDSEVPSFTGIPLSVRFEAVPLLMMSEFPLVLAKLSSAPVALREDPAPSTSIAAPLTKLIVLH